MKGEICMRRKKLFIGLLCMAMLTGHSMPVLADHVSENLILDEYSKKFDKMTAPEIRNYMNHIYRIAEKAEKRELKKFKKSRPVILKSEWNYKIVPQKKTIKRVYIEKISWKSMENADGYCIYLKSFPSGKMSKVKTIKGTGNSTFIKKMNSGKMDGKYQGYHEYYICGYMRTLQGKNEYSKFVKVPINNVEE